MYAACAPLRVRGEQRENGTLEGAAALSRDGEARESRAAVAEVVLEVVLVEVLARFRRVGHEVRQQILERRADRILVRERRPGAARAREAPVWRALRDVP